MESVVIDTNQDDDSDAAESSRFWAATAFAVVVIVIGVPVWLATTSVYRAHVPYTAIEQLQQLPLHQLHQQLQLPLAVELVVASADSKLLLSHLGADSIGCVSGVRRRDALPVERQLLADGGASAVDHWLHTQRRTVQTSAGVDNKHPATDVDTPDNSATATGENVSADASSLISVYIVDSSIFHNNNNINGSISAGSADTPVLGRQSVFLTPAVASRRLCQLVTEITNPPAVPLLTLASNKPPAASASAASNNPPAASAFADRFSVATSAHYDVVVTVAVALPDPSDPVSPALARATVDQLRPLVASVAPLARITLKSQFKYHATLGVPLSRDSVTGGGGAAGGGGHVLSRDQLALVVTPLERRLASVVSTAVTLHFVVFVPAVSDRPLRVQEHPAAPAAAAAAAPAAAAAAAPAAAADGNCTGGGVAFMAARWGGVYIANSPAEEAVAAGAVFAVQLRRLLGVPVVGAVSADGEQEGGTVSARRLHPALGRLELALWRRRRLVECLQRAVANLAALAAMLTQVSNIVVSDRVSAAVCAGTEHMLQAVQLWRAGDERGAYTLALSALQASETAVYHPSMLALLYFPYDQKYAIYIPLFLPVSIPVLGSLRMIVTYLRKRWTIQYIKKNV